MAILQALHVIASWLLESCSNPETSPKIAKMATVKIKIFIAVRGCYETKLGFFLISQE